MLPITLVVPTYRRTDMLARTMPTYLRQEVSEILVVDDGSPEDPTEVIRELAQGDPRVRILRLPENRGSPGARNAGGAAATQEYVLMLDDDVVLTDDYASTLYRHMMDASADLGAGRRIWLKDDEEPGRVNAERMRTVPIDRLVNRRHIAFDDEANFEGDAVVPLIGAMMMVRRDLFQQVKYDETTFGNTGWREETDFQVRAVGLGAKALACSKALCYHLPKSVVGRSGGQRAGRTLRYEWRLFQNNILFLRKNFRTLKALKFSPGPTPVIGALRAYFGFRVVSKLRHLLTGRGP